MASDLDPATAGWTESNVLAAAGENHTTAQQNAALENGGWLYGNVPMLAYRYWDSFTAGADGTFTGAPFDGARGAQGTAIGWFWHPAGYDYFVGIGESWVNAAGTGAYRVDLSTGDGTWLEDVMSGTHIASGNETIILCDSSGTVSSLPSNDLVEVRICMYRNADLTAQLRNFYLYCFGADQSSSLW